MSETAAKQPNKDNNAPEMGVLGLMGLTVKVFAKKVAQEFTKPKTEARKAEGATATMVATVANNAGRLASRPIAGVLTAVTSFTIGAADVLTQELRGDPVARKAKRIEKRQARAARFRKFLETPEGPEAKA